MLYFYKKILKIARLWWLYPLASGCWGLHPQTPIRPFRLVLDFRIFH